MKVPDRLPSMLCPVASRVYNALVPTSIAGVGSSREVWAARKGEFLVAYEYRVVPFIGQVKSAVVSQATGQEVAGQLQALIAQNAVDGWEFYRIETVNLIAAPGCLGGLMGQKAGFLNFNEVVFRHELKP
jgi:hypothetical protein